MKLLSIYRDKVTSHRGTPIRVRTILTQFAYDSEIELTVASWDEAAPVAARHLHLTNEHVRDAFDLIRFVRKEKIDVVMGHTISSYIYLIPLRLFTSAKIVLEMHGFQEEEALLYGNIGRVKYRMLKWLFGTFYRLCHFITTCSDTAADEIRKSNPNVLAVYGGADPALFSPREASSGRMDGIVIGYAGNASIWQGLDFLVEAFKRIRVDHPEFRLALLTNKPDKVPKLEGIESVGPFPYDQVPSFLADCDVLVIPRPQNRVNELSFPSKLVEYMAMGKPVVASRTSDADRVITDGVDGLIYEPGDMDGLVAALLRLRDSELRERVGRAAMETVHEKFTWERQVGMIREGLMRLRGDFRNI